jgi:hypothetical protein
MAVIFVSRPPGLWPMTTMRCSAGSVPSGSSLRRAACSASRSSIAEYWIGLPVL